MNTSQKPKLLVQTTCSILLAVVLTGGLASTPCQAEPPAGVPAPTNSVAATTPAPDAGAKSAVAARALSGAELYSIHCNRCHQERYPTERTGASWKTIMLHMQVRANIPVSQSKLILQYLQENSGR